MPRTKIVCTIGPASRSTEQLEALIDAGMNAARLNFSHGTQKEHGQTIRLLRELAARKKKPLSILQDLAGLKIRVGSIATETVQLNPGSRFILTRRDVPGDEHEVSISYADLPEEVHSGDTLLLSDGALDLEVEKIEGPDIICRVLVGGPLSSHKGINLPTRTIRASGLTEKDRDDLSFGVKEGVDYVALSFVRTVQEIEEARNWIRKVGGDVPVIAKIEKHEALLEIDSIIEAVDGIMVARGDLGVETPLQEIPRIQKMLIEKSNRSGKPVITATHMLRSMVDNPRPTRAEVTDVANAVLDGTDAVMLSEETAIGKYPVEAVRIMRSIAEDAESIFPYDLQLQRLGSASEKRLPEAVGFAACRLAGHIGAAAIVTCTESGSTARIVARYRPREPILALTPHEKTFRRLALSWGVQPFGIGDVRNTDQMIEVAVKAAARSGFARPGEKVVITAGVPVGVSGSTNLIKVEEAKG